MKIMHTSIYDTYGYCFCDHQNTWIIVWIMKTQITKRHMNRITLHQICSAQFYNVNKYFNKLKVIIFENTNLGCILKMTKNLYHLVKEQQPFNLPWCILKYYTYSNILVRIAQKLHRSSGNSMSFPISGHSFLCNYKKVINLIILFIVYV